MTAPKYGTPIEIEKPTSCAAAGAGLANTSIGANSATITRRLTIVSFHLLIQRLPVEKVARASPWGYPAHDLRRWRHQGYGKVADRAWSSTRVRLAVETAATKSTKPTGACPDLSRRVGSPARGFGVRPRGGGSPRRRTWRTCSPRIHSPGGLPPRPRRRCLLRATLPCP